MTLKDIRIKKGLTQQQLADEIGRRQQSIQQYEAGERRPSPDIIPKYAKTLGVTADELLQALPERKGA